MAEFYTRLQATASRLLKDKGQLVTFTRTTEGTFDPVTGKRTGTSESTFTADGVLGNYSGKEAGALRAAGVEVRMDDRKLLIAAPETPPDLGDKVTVGGTSYTILNIKPVNPAGTAITYELHLRR